MQQVQAKSFLLINDLIVIHFARPFTALIVYCTTQQYKKINSSSPFSTDKTNFNCKPRPSLFSLTQVVLNHRYVHSVWQKVGVICYCCCCCCCYLRYKVKQQDNPFVLNENCATKERRKLVREYSVTLKFTVAFAVYELAECGAFIKVEENNFLFCISNYREQFCCFAHQVKSYTIIFSGGNEISSNC